MFDRAAITIVVLYEFCPRRDGAATGTRTLTESVQDEAFITGSSENGVQNDFKIRI